MHTYWRRGVFNTLMLNINELWKIYLNKVRTLFWRKNFGEFGAHSRVLGRIVVYFPKKIKIGSHTSLNEGVLINARASIAIGNYVHISPYCIINAGGLDYSKTGEDRSHLCEPIVIKDGVWLGSGAIINPGVTIGENAVVAAGAVVTKSIAANMVAAGVPAREIKKISGEDTTLPETEG